MAESLTTVGGENEQEEEEEAGNQALIKGRQSRFRRGGLIDQRRARAERE